MSNLTALKSVGVPLELKECETSRNLPARPSSKSDSSNRIAHFPSQMSGGECQRVALARAMVSEPSLILADEPSGNLDHKTGREIMNLLFKLCRERGQSLILVTHNRELAKQSDRTLILSEGRLKKTQPDEQA